MSHAPREQAPAGPTWYDVLGVPRDADAAEIKAAWRSATDRFEPGSGSGQFQTFNEAAAVLLDPERRRSYDDSLDARDSVAEDSAPADQEPRTRAGLEGVSQSAVAGPGTIEPGVSRTERRTPRWLRRGTAPARDDEPRTEDASAPAATGWVAALGVLAVLLVLALVLAVVLGLQARQDDRVAEARRAAPVAAERAAEAILSYDYRRLPQDRKRAEGFLTDSYAKDYLETFRLLEEQKDGSPGVAVQSKTVVEAQVLRSGVVDAEKDKVRVLVYVNQNSQKQGADPQIFQNRVAMTMEKNGNRWLVDDLKSY
jgi:Mce-associated membrane protein